MRDLYDIDLSGVVAVRLCGGNTGDQSDDTNESCVTLALIPGTDGAMALGDSKRPDLPPLRFTSAEVDAFISQYVATRGFTQ
ncbi:DUF397 domain-containing protein [Kutzneria sp. NPDC052558]|uniref:DUF397 domain-containing protein n=1 Tax=Kutzneria sp. NPDC052558 TaxID=3364121 RepID=UPI0037C7FF62